MRTFVLQPMRDANIGMLAKESTLTTPAFSMATHVASTKAPIIERSHDTASEAESSIGTVHAEKAGMPSFQPGARTHGVATTTSRGSHHP